MKINGGASDGDEESVSSKTDAQAEMFANRLKKRLSHLKKWAKRTGTSAFRLYDRDIPEIPLVLDKYDDVVSGALYKRPYEKDEAEETQWLAAMRAAAAGAIDIEEDNIIIKRRERQRRIEGSGKPQYEKTGGRGLTRTVVEGELSFRVNLSDYLDTGLFLDKRALRRAVRSDSDGKRVLNLFCYTGSFSVCAAAGGASTDSVDLSNTYLRRARENFNLNGFQIGNGEWGTKKTQPEDFFSGPEPGLCRHRLIRTDVPVFLRRAAAAGRRWDMIILDPPAFSNSSMASADFDLRRDYPDLLKDCLSLLSPGGKILFTAAARSFKANAADIEIALAEDFPGVKVSDHSGRYIDEDFKGKKTPKIFVIES